MQNLIMLIFFNKKEINSHMLKKAIFKNGRPIFDIENDRYVNLKTDELDKILEKNRHVIDKAIPSVGRIEIREHPRYEWIGTAWLVAPDVVVTNRHVVMEFATKKEDKFVYRNYAGRTMRAQIDFKEERSQSDQIEFIVTDILHIEPDSHDAPDIAFLRIKTKNIDTDKHLIAEPIQLASEPAREGDKVVVIGYSADNGRYPNEKIEEIFGSVYNFKKIFPGTISLVDSSWIIQHDCTTSNGNSGSVVIDIQSGHAVGLHVGGNYLKTNYAIASYKILEIMTKYVI